jgi:putative transposase
MIEEKLRQRKNASRLKSFDYKGSYAYFITCCTAQRKPYFKRKAIVEDVLTVLKDVSEELDFRILAYCFMPEHLHFLVIGGEASSLAEFMKLFKQKSGFIFRKAHSNALWQRGYYDHVLRKEESLEEIALYIFTNPVRRGLVANYQDYPFWGSLVSDELNGQT